MNEQWAKICGSLQHKLNPGNYKVWIEPLQATIGASGVDLIAPTAFVADWIRERLLTEIAQSVAEVCGHSLPVRISSNKSLQQDKLILHHSAPSSDDKTLKKTASPEEKAPTVFSGREQMSLPVVMPVPHPVTAPMSWRYAFETFIVGTTNNMAYAAARNMIRPSSSVDMLFLSSGPGLGKTHLTQAVGHALCQASNRSQPRVEYLTAEEFASSFVQALRTREMDRFKGRFRDLDLLLLEDIHFLQGKEKMQEEVLSTIKTLQGRGGKVVLTSSFAPCELKNVDTQLVSRFCSGFIAGIEKPDAETRRRILVEKAKEQQVALPFPVLDMLTDRLTGDIRQMESCVHTLVLKSQIVNQPPSIEMATEILGQYAQDTLQITLEEIIRKVGESFGFSFEQICSRSRKQSLVLARNTIFYLARRYTELSLQDIGERFNRRHSTVLKGISAVEKELGSETSLGRQIASTLSLVDPHAKKTTHVHRQNEAV